MDFARLARKGFLAPSSWEICSMKLFYMVVGPSLALAIVLMVLFIRHYLRGGAGSKDK